MLTRRIAKNSHVVCMAQLLPFFELYTFTMLINRNVNAGFFTIVHMLYSVARTAISVKVIIEFFLKTINKKKWYGKAWIGVIYLCIALTLATVVNKSIYNSFFLGLFNYVGFALLCEKLLNTNEVSFYRGGILLFGILSTLGMLSILFFPMGFFNDSITDYAVYFLGSKNASIFYYLMFILFLMLYDLQSRIRRLKKVIPVLVILMTITVLICKSANSLFCLLLIAFYYLFSYQNKLFRRLLSPRFFIVSAVLIFYFVVFAKNSPLVTSILSIFQKSSNYTGRSYFWEQALSMIVSHPIFGNGANSTFSILGSISGIIYPQAHNFYLDYFAKYGFVPLLIIIACSFYWMNRAWNAGERKRASLVLFFFFTLLIHSIFDDISLYYIFIMICLTEKCATSFSHSTIYSERLTLNS